MLSPKVTSRPVSLKPSELFIKHADHQKIWFTEKSDTTEQDDKKIVW